jgi:hypothetical protein
MKNYLSSAQVADYLGITRDALNARIRAGEFTEPDVTVGDRFQGWSAETVEQFRRQAEGDGIGGDTDATAELVTTIRQVAEYVRSYGDSATDPAIGIHRTVPLALHLIAARLENEIRTIAVWDKTTARRHHPDPGSDPTIYEVTQLPLPFGSVASMIYPANTDNITRAAQLRLVADITGSVMAQMRDALWTPVARHMMAALGAERDKILSYADALDAEATATS